VIQWLGREREVQNAYPWRTGPSDSTLLHFPSNIQTLSLATGDGKLVIKRRALTTPRSRPPQAKLAVPSSLRSSAAAEGER
jgi:hypothetical protein